MRTVKSYGSAMARNCCIALYLTIYLTIYLALADLTPGHFTKEFGEVLLGFCIGIGAVIVRAKHTERMGGTAVTGRLMFDARTLQLGDERGELTE